MPRTEVVETFGIALATLKRWLKRRREGTSPRGHHGGRKRRILSTVEERRALWAQLE
jgi:hypothetical protein